MLATLVIGLREGLEAALVVGIIAAFLKRNGKPLTAMWIGVASAIALSLLVGLTLHVVERALPQAEQEAMETVVGAVAIVFVTGMVLWMRTRARFMRRELEASATDALGRGSSLALAGMAFLAVLKEGFETSVFLVATFQASADATAAVGGAIVGIMVAIGIGIGLYTGGVRLNLGKFFTVTGVFLVFVAAGLVVYGLRTAHGAGWLQFGQQATVDLSWLAPGGSIRSALITGVLGIPADPRAVEVVGWFAYLIPMLLIVLLPNRLRPSLEHRPRVYAAAGGALGIGAAALFVFVPAAPAAHTPKRADLAHTGSVRLVAGSPASLRITRGAKTTHVDFTADDAAEASQHGGGTRWRTSDRSGAGHADVLTLDRLVDLNGGTVPVGINPRRNQGPFNASWKDTATITAWTRNGGLVDAERQSRSIVTLTGGGLGSPRVITLADGNDWHVADAAVAKSTDAIATAAADHRARSLWTTWLPAALAIGALATAGRGLALRRSIANDRAGADAPSAERDADTVPASETPQTNSHEPRSATNAS